MDNQNKNQKSKSHSNMYNKAYFAKRSKIAKQIQNKHPGMTYEKALEYANKVMKDKG